MLLFWCLLVTAVWRISPCSCAWIALDDVLSSKMYADFRCSGTRQGHLRRPILYNDFARSGSTAVRRNQHQVPEAHHTHRDASLYAPTTFFWLCFLLCSKRILAYDSIGDVRISGWLRILVVVSTSWFAWWWACCTSRKVPMFLFSFLNSDIRLFVKQFDARPIILWAGASYSKFSRLGILCMCNYLIMLNVRDSATLPAMLCF